MKTYYHFAKADLTTQHTNEPIILNETLTAKGPLKLCKNGLHAAIDPLDALRYAPGPVVCIVTLDENEMLIESDKVCSRSRTVIKYKNIEKELRLFAIRVAEDVLPFFEKKYPDDKRPREAIEAAKLYADGKITREKLIEKRHAAAAAADVAAAADAAAAAYAADVDVADVADAAYIAAYATDTAADAYAGAAYAAAAATTYAYAYAYVARKKAREKYNGWLKEIIEKELEG